MAKVKIHAGDFHKFDAHVGFNYITLRTDAHPWAGEVVPLTELEAVEIATEESVKKVGGTVGWGIAGGAVFGPVGLLAGLLLGGRKTEVTFVARFKDGRKLLGTTDSKTYRKLAAAAFD